MIKTFAHVTLRSGEKMYVAFEDDATREVAVCNLPSFSNCNEKDIPAGSLPIHFWYYGDRNIEVVNKNPIAKEK